MLPAEIVVSIGMGLVFVTGASTALVGVADRDAGVASALVNTSGPTATTCPTPTRPRPDNDNLPAHSPLRKGM